LSWGYQRGPLPNYQNNIYLVVFLAVALGHALALLPKVLLESRVDDQFFRDRMAGQLPHELVSVSRLMVMVGGIHNLVVAFLQCLVVVDDNIANCRQGPDASTQRG
jgi:hypothetical protein